MRNHVFFKLYFTAISGKVNIFSQFYQKNSIIIIIIKMNEDKDLKCPKKGENMAFPVQALFRFIIYLFIYQLPKGSTLGSRDLVSPFFFYYNDSFCTSLTTSKDLYFFFFLSLSSTYCRYDAKEAHHQKTY